MVSTLFGPVAAPVPSGPISHPDVEWDGTELKVSGDWCQTSGPTIPTTTASPMVWYLADHERHEWLAVSLAMRANNKPLLNNDPVFTRSLAPSVSTRRALNNGRCTNNNETKTTSIVDLDDCDLPPLTSSPIGQPRDNSKVPPSPKLQFRGTTPGSLHFDMAAASSSATYLDDSVCLIPMYQGSRPTLPP